MAYGVLYEFHRTSTNGADFLITISQKGYDGEVKRRALGRAPVMKRENNGHIYGTSCELYAECLVDGEFSHLYTSNAYEFKVEVYKNNNIIWMGYVSPELYSEPDIAPPYDVQIIATDGLGELKNFSFEKRGVASIINHIDFLMDKTGIETSWNVVSGLRYVNESGVASNDKDILDVKVNLDHESGSTYYEVLQNLLASLNANITQLNGKYLIFRETDFINKSNGEWVDAFDVNGTKITLPVARFGTMKSCQWWPVGQLSTVIEPAKNQLVLQSPNNYKENVVNFDAWEMSENASFNHEEGAYVLHDQGAAITQSINFGGSEVGYRLGLRVRARNVGSSLDEQNIGIKVEVKGRSYIAGTKFWLVKSAATSGRPMANYMWRSVEGAIEEDLPAPTDGDTAADAQDIDVIVPLYSSGTRSFAYAKDITLTVFNPQGANSIYVYGVTLVKYEQIKGYEATVVIKNDARESDKDINLNISDAGLAPLAGSYFMTGLPMYPSGADVIIKWQIGNNTAADYLSTMAFDYSRALALPKMKYSGILNVPKSATWLPTLFLRDGTYYFPKTYSYDLYADEITVELVSISAADVSLSSLVISQTSEAVGNVGGVNTGGASGGGSSVGGASYLNDLADVTAEDVEDDSLLYFDGETWVDRPVGKVMSPYDERIRKIEDWFREDKDGNIYTPRNLYSLGQVSSKGLGEVGEEGIGGNGVSSLDSLLDVEIDLEGLSVQELSQQGLRYDVAEQIWKNKTLMVHHVQSEPQRIWKINHNLGKFPNVKIVDSVKQLCMADIFYDDDNNVTIQFGSAQSGSAYLD